MKRTPLYPAHVALNARLVDFAGWEMPIQYRSGINEEHNAVRTSCGIFDVSHMGQIRVTGPGAVAFLQYVALNDAGRLKVDRAQYSMLANDQGGLIDDIYVYRDGEDDFLLVPNASNHGVVLAHLNSLATDRPDVKVTDESSEWTVMAVQGPDAVRILSQLTGTDLAPVRKNATIRVTLNGREVRLTRTGYTGEDGFEVFTAPGDAVAAWDAITAAGAVPCGLGARDTLRLEAGFPLFGNELTATSNPLCTPMAWLVKDKEAYGRAALVSTPCERVLVGLELRERGIPRSGYRILHEGNEAGVITSGTISPFSRKAIALGWVSPELAAAGTELSVEIRGQAVEAVVVEPPFNRN